MRKNKNHTLDVSLEDVTREFLKRDCDPSHFSIVSWESHSHQTVISWESHETLMRSYMIQKR